MRAVVVWAVLVVLVVVVVVVGGVGAGAGGEGSPRVQRQCDELLAGWRPIRHNALDTLLPHQRFIYLQEGQRVPAKDPHIMHPGLRNDATHEEGEAEAEEAVPHLQQKGASDYKNRDQAQQGHTLGHQSEQQQQQQQQQQEEQEEQEVAAERPVPRFFEPGDFETQYDKFPDERFASPSNPPPHMRRPESQARAPSPQPDTAADVSAAESDKPDIPDFALQDFGEGDKEPDVPSPEIEAFVNHIADWSTRQEGDSSVLDLLLEHGTKLEQLNETKWADWSCDALYYGKHTDLRPTFVRDSPLKEWPMVNWTKEEWVEKVHYLNTLSVSNHRDVLYFGMSPVGEMMLQAWKDEGVPNPDFAEQFTKQYQLPVSVIPYFRPPQGVRSWPKMQSVFDSVHKDQRLYGFNTLTRSRFNRLRSEMEKPEELLYYDEDTNTFSTTLWVNTNSAVAPFHYDSSNIWHGMLRGRKRFYYLPQKDVFNLYLYPPTHPMYRNSFVCVSCPRTREDAEELLEKFPHLLDIETVYYVDLGPGDFTAMPSFWPHEVACLDDLCLSVSSGRNVDELAAFKNEDLLLTPVFDALWEMGFQDQLQHTQAFFVVVAHRVLQGTGIPGCNKEATCLKAVVRRAIDNFYGPTGVFQDAERVPLPCPPLKVVLRKLNKPKERAKMMQVLGPHIDRIVDVWNGMMEHAPSRYGHFVRWLAEQSEARLKWFEVPLLLFHCLR